MDDTVRHALQNNMGSSPNQEESAEPPSSAARPPPSTSHSTLSNNPDLLVVGAKLRELERDLSRSEEQRKLLNVELKKAKNKISQLIAKSKEGEDLGEKLIETSQKLVEEAEKSLKTTSALETLKSKLADERSEKAQFREQLLQGINGGVSDVDNYTHISLSDLLRLRLQEADNKAQLAADAAKSAPSMSSTLPKHGIGASDIDVDAEAADGGAADGVNGIQKMEKELEDVKGKNRKLQSKYDRLEAQLDDAFQTIEALQKVQSKNVQLQEQTRNQKDLRAKTEGALRLSNKKVEALSDHIEKLMLHLKHEATSKAKAFEERSKASREVDLLRAKNEAITKKNKGRDRVIVELKEGAKILEDQLRLMDEKYMELRTKLDWTRLQSEKTVKKKEDEARSLRTKFALMQGSFSGGALLDSIEIGDDGRIIEPSPSSKSKSGKKGKSGMMKSASGAVLS